MNGNPILELGRVSASQSGSSVRSAASTAAGEQAAAQAIGALKSIGIAAFLCDAQARICALTPYAEAILVQAGPLRQASGVLMASDERVDLSGAIRRVGATTTMGETLLIPSPGEAALVLDITPLLSEDWAAGLTVRTVITVRGRAFHHGDQEHVLRNAFGLTAAEAGIALRLARGATREAIAAEREVSVATIRSQIKSIYQKMGVTREIELAACLASLL